MKHVNRCSENSKKGIAGLLRLATRHGATFKLSREATGALVSAFEQRLLSAPAPTLPVLTELLNPVDDEDEGPQLQEVELKLPSNPIELAFRARCYPALVVCNPIYCVF